MFLRTKDYPFAKLLESNWRSVQAEALKIPSKDYQPWPEYYLHGKDWFVFGLNYYGNFIKQNCDKCPITAKLLKQIPYLKTAGFSLLQSNAIIKPHQGKTKSIVRCHLGLLVPDNCGIKVAGIVKRWTEGKCLIFDDTSEHEAWNHSSKRRIVLLIDTTRPKIKWDQEWNFPKV